MITRVVHLRIWPATHERRCTSTHECKNRCYDVTDNTELSSQLTVYISSVCDILTRTNPEALLAIKPSDPVSPPGCHPCNQALLLAQIPWNKQDSVLLLIEHVNIICLLPVWTRLMAPEPRTEGFSTRRGSNPRISIDKVSQIQFVFFIPSPGIIGGGTFRFECLHTLVGQAVTYMRTWRN